MLCKSTQPECWLFASAWLMLRANLLLLQVFVEHVQGQRCIVVGMHQMLQVINMAGKFADCVCLRSNEFLFDVVRDLKKIQPGEKTRSQLNAFLGKSESCRQKPTKRSRLQIQYLGIVVSLVIGVRVQLVDVVCLGGQSLFNVQRQGQRLDLGQFQRRDASIAAHGEIV